MPPGRRGKINPNAGSWENLPRAHGHRFDYGIFAGKAAISTNNYVIEYTNILRVVAGDGRWPLHPLLRSGSHRVKRRQ